MRLPRAFYTETYVFREFSVLNATLHQALRQTVKEPVQAFASVEDAFYGAFKLGEAGDPDENVMDSDILLLTEGHVAVLNSNLQIQWMERTADILLPSKSAPNPILVDKNMTITMADGSTVRQVLFADLQKAKAAQVLF